MLAVVATSVAIAAIVAAAVSGGSAQARPQATLKVGLVTDIGGLNDRGFNHLAYLGATRAKKKLGIDLRVLTSTSNSDYVPNLATLARQHYDLIIAVGFLMTDAIDAVGSAFPKDRFAIVDVDVATLKHHPKNVLGLIFKEQQAGYLVGYAAGLWAKDKGANAVGSVGGLKIPPVDRYIAGFQYGAKKAFPGVTTLNDYSQDFVKQAKCKEAALNQIAQGSVVEFQVAGQCGLGVLDAAHEKKVYGIGADADQGYLGSWVMTSALKRVDVSVYNAIKQARGKGFRGGHNDVFTAHNNGVGVGKWAKGVPASIRRAVAQQYKLLKAGKAKGIPTTVK
jgi:basic membrane protein A